MKISLRSTAWILTGAIWTSSCVYDVIPTNVDCSKSDLSIRLLKKVDATTCKSIDGGITMEATGGSPPYDFSLGDGIYQTNPFFDNLGPGSYLVTVKDTKLCKSAIEVEIAAQNSDLNATVTATADTACPGGNGTITVTPTGGVAPYEITIDGTSSVTGFGAGNHTVIIIDAEDCQRTVIVNVPHGNSGTSYVNDIVPILNANCNVSGCHGPGTGSRDWTNFNNVKSHSDNIKARTGNGTMPIGGFTLTSTEIALIACWVDDGAPNN